MLKDFEIDYIAEVMQECGKNLPVSEIEDFWKKYETNIGKENVPVPMNHQELVDIIEGSDL